MEKELGITIIGSGNVACHLGKALATHFTIDAVFSRNIDNAQQLAKSLGTVATNEITKIPRNSDLYLISVSDDAIQPVVQSLNNIGGLVVHTSGSTPMTILASFARHGVFYPFQTFSKHKTVDMNQVPILIEANNHGDAELLARVASSISANVSKATSEQRQKLHIAAVFACNFANHLYTIAGDILDDANLNFNLLHPLISETAKKACTSKPSSVQTGPAVRGDSGIVNKHLEMLSGQKENQQIYRILSDSIAARHKVKLETKKD